MRAIQCTSYIILNTFLLALIKMVITMNIDQYYCTYINKIQLRAQGSAPSYATCMGFFKSKQLVTYTSQLPTILVWVHHRYIFLFLIMLLST